MSILFAEGLVCSVHWLNSTQLCKILLDSEGSTEDAYILQQKLTERYDAYLESQEMAMVSVPDREETLTSTHITNEQRHQQAVDMLQAYLDDGTRSEKSLHLKTLFSSGSSRASVVPRKKSLAPNRYGGSQASKAKSDSRLSEARVQAQIAKRNVEQFKALREAQQKKLDMEREAARQQMELEQLEGRKRLERKEEEARRRIEQEEELYHANLQRKLLKEETERQQRELEHEIEMQKRIAELERLKEEVNIREREELRSVLGSDLDSDEEHEDVTSPKRARLNLLLDFKTSEAQQSQMREYFALVHRDVR